MTILDFTSVSPFGSTASWWEIGKVTITCYLLVFGTHTLWVACGDARHLKRTGMNGALKAMAKNNLVRAMARFGIQIGFLLVTVPALFVPTAHVDHANTARLLSGIGFWAIQTLIFCTVTTDKWTRDEVVGLLAAEEMRKVIREEIKRQKEET